MALGQRGDSEEDKELLVEGARSNRGFRAQPSLPSVPNNVRTARSVFLGVVRASVSPALSALLGDGAPRREVWWCLRLVEPG